MTKEEFIEKNYCCGKIEYCNQDCELCKKEFTEDLDQLIKDSWPTTLCELNSYQHVMKCPKCNGWVYFNDESIKVETNGGHIKHKSVHCDCCNEDVSIYPWRCL